MRKEQAVKSASILFSVSLLVSVAATDEDRLPSNTRADEVVVAKSARTLALLNHGQVIRIYKVALGGKLVGAKARQGDHRTPEGAYVGKR